MVKKKNRLKSILCCCTFSNVNRDDLCCWVFFFCVKHSNHWNWSIFKNLKLFSVGECPLYASIQVLLYCSKHSIIKQKIKLALPLQSPFQIKYSQKFRYVFDGSHTIVWWKAEWMTAYSFSLKSKSAHIMKNRYKYNTYKKISSSIFVYFLFLDRTTSFRLALCCLYASIRCLYHKHTNASRSCFAYLTK